MSKPMDKGKWAEGKTQDWLATKASAVSSFAWHRMPDARAARNALAAQPADFLVSYRRPGSETFTCFLEVKETAEARRLPKSKLSQFGKLYMFHLAGIHTRVLVYRSAHDDWVYFTEDDLFFYDTSPTSFPFEDLATYSTAASALQGMFP